MVAIRVRGASGVPYKTDRTLRQLRLTKKNWATILYNRPELAGMLINAKDYITWGEATPEALGLLLENRGRTTGNRRLTESFVKKELKLPSLAKLADSISRTDVKLHDLWKKGLKPIFRLHPPKGGYRGSIKRPFKDGGELGYRGKAIDEVISKMA